VTVDVLPRRVVIAESTIADGHVHVCPCGVRLSAGWRELGIGIPAADGLTQRELEVLWLAARGGTNIRIARALGISARTVEKHLTRAYHKLNASGRADAVLRAFAPRAV